MSRVIYRCRAEKNKFLGLFTGKNQCEIVVESKKPVVYNFLKRGYSFIFGITY